MKNFTIQELHSPERVTPAVYGDVYENAHFPTHLETTINHAGLNGLGIQSLVLTFCSNGGVEEKEFPENLNAKVGAIADFIYPFVVKHLDMRYMWIKAYVTWEYVPQGDRGIYIRLVYEQ